MKNLLKRIFSDIPFFYNIYFKFVRSRAKNVPRYFGPDVKFFFDGYQRSGNTFFVHLVRNIFAEYPTVHHLHKIAPIKIALSKKLPVCILIREPQECISSNYLYFYAGKGDQLPESVNLSLLQEYVDDYYSYYNFVKSLGDKCYIIEFNELINHPEKIIIDVAKLLKNQTPQEQLVEKVNFFKQNYREKDKGKTPKSQLAGQKPSELKEKLKQSIKHELHKLDVFKQCESTYKSIIKSDNFN